MDIFASASSPTDAVMSQTLTLALDSLPFNAAKTAKHRPGCQPISQQKSATSSAVIRFRSSDRAHSTGLSRGRYHQGKHSPSAVCYVSAAATAQQRQNLAIKHLTVVHNEFNHTSIIFSLSRLLPTDYTAYVSTVLWSRIGVNFDRPASWPTFWPTMLILL